MKKSVYFIPTNRPVERCAASYVKEIIFAKEKFGLEIPLIVVESNTESFVRNNRNILDNLRKQYPGTEIYHFTFEKQSTYFDLLFKGLDKCIKDKFITKYKNYGATMNRLFLFAESFQAEIFHRRDSDTSLLFNNFENLKEEYPIEIELKFLGKRISELSAEDHVQVPAGYDGEKQIFVVGSNYYGEWNLDVKDFARRSFEIVYKLYELLGFPAEEVKNICDSIFQFDEPISQEEILKLITSVNDGNNPDCGNVAVYSLHRYLPVLSAKNTLACDYFIFDVSTAYGLPQLYHNRKVFHEYHKNRFEFAKKFDYWVGVAKFADYFNSYMDIYNSLPEDLHIKNPKEFSDKNVREKLIQKILGFAEKAVYERANRIKKIAAEILIPFDENYKSIGERMLKEANDYIAEANREYEFHTELIGLWPELIDRAGKIDLRSFLCNV